MRLFAALLCLIAAWSVPARAHLTPNSELHLTFGERAVAAELLIPLGELGYALGRPIAARPGPIAGTELAALARYLTDRIAVSAPDGRAWRVAMTGLEIVSDGTPPDLVARLTLTPPRHAPARRFILHYAAVIDRMPDHFVLVLADSDFAGGLAEPEMLGGLQAGARTLAVDRGGGSRWRGFASAVRLGMHHIAEGHDHLLFLFALLLPAPLVARGVRWGGFAGLRRTAARLLAVVTAFTIGHSATLVLGTAFALRLPAQPVEIGIALSILVSAIHALRPLFPGREALVAGGFGLVHGLAFATLIGRFGLDPAQKALSILGFNLGIELVQLMCVAALMPALLMLAATPAYRPFRVAGGLVAAAAASVWLVERAAGWDSGMGAALDTAMARAPWLLAAVTVAAAFAFLRRRRSEPAA